MKRRVAVLGICFLALPLLTFAVPGDRAKQWQKVKEAMDKGLPKTAIEYLEPIIAAAIKDKAYPEAIKAITRKISLEGNIQGNKPEEKITRLQAAIAKSPPEMVPVMDAILANWYWHYFQQNRWRFLRRTATAQSPGKDFTTWDLPRILDEIDKQLSKALAADKKLKAIPIGDYGDLLEKGTAPDSYRPTLYDFLAYNALAFYATGEQAGSKAEDAFELTADSPIFDPSAEFLKWVPKTTDTASRTLKAIRLYQDLLRFHEGDKDRSAFLDADLQRLVFGYNKAFGEDKNQRYKNALKRLADANEKHEVGVRALYHWASVLQQEGDLVRARDLALKGEKALPNSYGGKLCHNLVQQIEAKSSSITTERVWNAPWPTIDVHYRNLTKIYFRAIASSFDERIKTASWRPEYLSREEQEALLQKKPALEWSADLPATPDYHDRTEKLLAPKTLKPGFYFLVSSHDASFGANDNTVNYSAFWVSTLALVMRTRNGEGAIDGFVLDANSGNPLAGAELKAWYSPNWQSKPRIATAPVKSDANGYFRFDGVTNRNYLVHAHYKDQELHSANDFWVNHYNLTPKPYSTTVFFTDRSLYRPGQTIQYRGLCVSVDQGSDNYKVLGSQKLTVVFNDPNGKEIARRQHSTNDYGSFDGSFIAPANRVMGRMTISVLGEPRGSTGFNVEEYKRPKFEVTLEKPKTAAKLNGPLVVTGKALAYTGAPVDGAKLRYRVFRQVRYPTWWGCCYWWRPMPAQPSQEIAHGIATTRKDGTFTVQFIARPDLSVPAKDEPIFVYTVSADVTDHTGETRSGQIGVKLGYTALQAELSAADWQTAGKEVVVTPKTTTLDGEPQQAEGTIKVYRLKQPEKVHRAPLQGHYYQPRQVWIGGKLVEKEPEPDLSNPHSWPLGEVVAEQEVKTDKTGTAKLTFKLSAGAYRAVLETKDAFGKPVTARLPIQVLDPAAKHPALKVPSLVAAPKWTVEPGMEFSLLWGTGYDKARAYIEIEQRRKLLQSFWTEPGKNQVTVKQAVTKALRGGFTVRVTMVRENRAYLESRRVEVPWSNKELKIRWEHFVSKLEPGQKETWTAIVTGPSAARAVAEMVATLYDESLDAYLPHHWPERLHVFRQDYSNVWMQFENVPVWLQHLHGGFAANYLQTDWRYRSFPPDIASNLWGYEYFGYDRKGGGRMDGAPTAPGAALPEEKNAAEGEKDEQQRGARKKDSEGGLGGTEPPTPDLAKVTPRKNLNETAFFYPHLLSNKEGEVKLQFTMPEALTRWKFMAFAHDKDLRNGYLQDSVVTARDLMVQPNPPRFVREGDVLEFTVKVTNQSDEVQAGTVSLTLSDVRTGKAVDEALENTKNEKSFNIPARESRSFAWRLKVPDGMGFLSYKAVGSTGKVSDGEEGYLPVLSRRVLVIESMSLPIRGPQTKHWEFKRLLESGKSNTLKHQSLTVQVASNPTWYAVMALPYLMEQPYECTEQTFNRLYANTLARFIANSDPKIRKVFDQWKGTPALDSPLEKNKELRAVMLEETPWVRQAEAESQARRNVGILFDANRLDQETTLLLQRMADLQQADGAWPWFPGGPPSDYITLYITTGFGRLRHLGVKNLDLTSAVKSINRLDGWIDHIYQEIVRRGWQAKNNLTPTIALYLYGRSFFIQDKVIEPKYRPAVDYFLGQAKAHWLKLANRQSQAHLALALHRFGDKAAAKGIMKSIKERAVSNEELGMFWRDLELSWWWFRAPIETQAMMIEAFDEVVGDAKAVEECQVWLIKQKQTQDWKTTKATADAVYGLLLRGTNSLASDALVEITLDSVAIQPEKVEAGTGFYEKRFVGSQVKPELGKVTMKKVDKGVAWGSLHWQYLEDVNKVTAYEGTPLTLKKALYTKVNTKKGPVLVPVKGAVKVGDELVVRMELRVVRDMEYVHLKDARGSGTEPVNVLSRYRFQDGLAYYETTRDTASHFFIDYLPKGTYVFEYSTRVVHRGEYSTGMAEIQCMYAPEFNSHSQSFVLRAEE
jgi:uncharacterized protein YfaS (alpha-2-macroglobulin family)